MATPPPVPGLSAARTLKLLTRSFLLQAAWNYERMQSVGFASALAGEGRRLHRKGGQAFLTRHLGYFNTNPVLASYLIGAVLRLEEDQVSESTLSRFKKSLSSTLAAWGDALFWGTLRPAATVLGVLIAGIFSGWGVAAYLMAYNSWHLFYRIRGLPEGYRHGLEIGGRLSQSEIRKLPERIRLAGLFLWGALAALSFTSISRQSGLAGLAGALTAAGLAYLGLRRWAGRVNLWGLAAAAGGLAYAWLGTGR